MVGNHRSRKSTMAVWDLCFAIVVPTRISMQPYSLLFIHDHGAIIQSLHSQKTKRVPREQFKVAEHNAKRTYNNSEAVERSQKCRFQAQRRKSLRSDPKGDMHQVKTKHPVGHHTMHAKKNAALCNNESISFFLYNFFFSVQTPYLCVEICFVNVCSFLKHNC